MCVSDCTFQPQDAVQLLDIDILQYLDLVSTPAAPEPLPQESRQEEEVCFNSLFNSETILSKSIEVHVSLTVFFLNLSTASGRGHAIAIDRGVGCYLIQCMHFIYMFYIVLLLDVF